MKILRIIAIALYSTISVLHAMEDTFVVTNVRLFDGDKTHENTDVLVRDGIVSDIGEIEKISTIEQIAGDGCTLIPGLIDGHTHTESIDQLQDSIIFGVTTILDMGTFPEFDAHLREAAASRMDVADFRSSGIFITPPGGHGTEYGYAIDTLVDPSKAEGFVEERIRLGADYLKVVINGVRHERNPTPTMPSGTVRAVVKASHKRGKLVLAHVESVEDVEIAISAEVDGLVHAWRDAGSRPDIAKLIKSKGIFVMPSLAIYDGIEGKGPKQMLTDERVHPFLSAKSTASLQQEVSFTPSEKMMKENDERFQDLIDEGVTILAGSDAFTHNPRVAHGASFQHLLELMVEKGLTPEEAIKSATSSMADAFNFSDRGRIKIGLNADFLLVEGNPLRDISAIKDIVSVWRRGVRVERRPNSEE